MTYALFALCLLTFVAGWAVALISKREKKAPKQPKKFVMYGFDSRDAIPPGKTATLSTAPQKRHVPTRLTISRFLANSFAVSDVRIGVEPLLATPGNLSAAVFEPNAASPCFRPVLAEVGMDVTVVVTNTSDAPQRFIAAMAGVELPEPDPEVVRKLFVELVRDEQLLNPSHPLHGGA